MEAMVNQKFWNNKKVFITGHTGFKGTWLSLWLQLMGAKVKGYALSPNTSPSLFEELNISENIESVFADIRELNTLTKELKEFSPEIVIHMAAQPLVRLSYEDPVMTFETNVMGTVNLLESIKGCSTVRAVVNVTTDKCYENKEWLWGYREDEHLGGYDPYSNSKACSELVTSSYRQSFFNKESFDSHGVALASARAGNVIGGGDWALDRIIPDIIRSFSQNKKVIIRSPQAIRPWQHVLEPLSGYLCLAQKLFEEGMDYAEAWNFGPDEKDAKPVSWIADTMSQHWGESAGWLLDNNSNPHEAHYLKLDCSKAKTLLKWEARWSLEKTLEKICAWHKAHLNNADMRQHTINEITEFMKDDNYQ